MNEKFQHSKDDINNNNNIKYDNNNNPINSLNHNGMYNGMIYREYLELQVTNPSTNQITTNQPINQSNNN